MWYIKPGVQRFNLSSIFSFKFTGIAALLKSRFKRWFIEMMRFVCGCVRLFSTSKVMSVSDGCLDNRETAVLFILFTGGKLVSAPRLRAERRRSFSDGCWDNS